MGDTAFTTIPVEDSRFFGTSIRGWLVTILVITVCFSHVLVVIGALYDALISKNYDRIGALTTIGEPLYSMSVAALGFYFGQKTK